MSRTEEGSQTQREGGSEDCVTYFGLSLVQLLLQFISVHLQHAVALLQSADGFHLFELLLLLGQSLQRGLSEGDERESQYHNGLFLTTYELSSPRVIPASSASRRSACRAAPSPLGPGAALAACGEELLPQTPRTWPRRCPSHAGRTCKATFHPSLSVLGTEQNRAGRVAHSAT